MNSEKEISPSIYPWHYGIAIALFVFTIAYRLPSRVTTVFDWDNVQYLLALEKFDILAHQPHPTGYPLFVFFGWIVSKIVGDPQLGLTLVTLIMYAAGAVCVYFFGRKISGDMLGIGAGLIYAFSPIGGFFTSFPNTFAVEAGMASILWLVLMDWIYFDSKDKSARAPNPILLAWTYGILGGFRMSFLLFSLPAVAYLVLIRNPKAAPKMILHASIAILIWFIPLIIASGGLTDYMLASTAETEAFVRPFDTGNILQNIDMFLNASMGMLSIFFVVPILYGIIAGFYLLFKRDETDSGRRSRIFAVAIALWTIPSALFFIKNFMHPGFIFFFMPMAALGVFRLGDFIIPPFVRYRLFYFSIRFTKFLLRFPLIVVLILYGDWSANDDSFFSRKTLDKTQRHLQAFHDEIRENFPPEKTVIVSWEHFRDTAWVFPQSYVVYPQAAYARETGIPEERANLYMMHEHVLQPRPFHLKRAGPIAPIELPDEVQYMIVSPADYERLKHDEEFNVGETSEGEKYFWRKIDPPIKIRIEDGKWTYRGSE